MQNIDPERLIKKVYSRNHCKICGDITLKDLRIIRGDLRKVVILENKVSSFYGQLSNGVFIEPYYGSKSDTKLHYAASLLLRLSKVTDVRKFLQAEFHMEEIFKYFMNID